MSVKFMVQVWIDRDYEGGMRMLRNLLATVAPQIEPFDTLQGMVSQIDNYISGFLRGDSWTIDKWREEYQLLMKQADSLSRDANRFMFALQRVAALADTGSGLHKATFDPDGVGIIENGWRVAEKMREVAVDALGLIATPPNLEKPA